MRSRLSIFNFKSRDPLAGIVLFVLLVVAIEGTLSFLPPNSMVKSFRLSRVPAGPAADVQIMGDSVAQGGIIAGQLATALPEGNIVYNYAIAGTGPEFPYFLLKREIEAGKTPKAILYAPSPHTFGSLRIPRLIGAYCDWLEIGEVAASGLQPMEVLYGVFCKLSYTLRHREEILGLVKGGPKKTAARVEQATTTTVPAKPRFPAAKLHPMYKKGFEVEPFNRHHLHKFLTLAARHDIAVYWVTMPVLPVVQESRRQFNFETAYYDFLERMRQEYNVQILQKEFLVFGEEDFIDYTHLNQTAAERFTRILEGKLAALTATNGVQRLAGSSISSSPRQ